MSRHLSLRYGNVILVSGYPVLTAINWPQHECAITGCRLPYQLESVKFNIGCPVVRTDGRSDGRAYDQVTTKFSQLWGSARAREALLLWSIESSQIGYPLTRVTITAHSYVFELAFLHVLAPTFGKLLLTFFWIDKSI